MQSVQNYPGIFIRIASSSVYTMNIYNFYRHRNKLYYLFIYIARPTCFDLKLVIFRCCKFGNGDKLAGPEHDPF
jgi:hypothetical protein